MSNLFLDFFAVSIGTSDKHKLIVNPRLATWYRTTEMGGLGKPTDRHSPRLVGCVKLKANIFSSEHKFFCVKD